MICTIALASAVVAAGCGGAGTVDRAQVEEKAQTELSKTVGQEAPRPECPDDLEQKVGTTMRCQMDFPGGERLGLTVKVVSVDGSDSKLSFMADDKLSKQP